VDSSDHSDVEDRTPAALEEALKVLDDGLEEATIVIIIILIVLFIVLSFTLLSGSFLFLGNWRNALLFLGRVRQGLSILSSKAHILVGERWH